MSLNTENEELIELLKGCAKNQRAAQKEIYQLFYSYAMSICIRYAHNREDALEVMNDGFMRVFTYIKKFDLDKPFKPWLRRILINCSIDRVKSEGKHEGFFDLEIIENKKPAEPEHDPLAYEEILKLVKELTPAYRLVFNLYAIDGYKHHEIAEKLGISVGTSKSNYFKAKQKLQERLKLLFEVDK